MKKLIAAVVIMGSFLGSVALTAQSTRAKVIAQFRGSSLKWIHAAEPEFQ
jgi:hypothetical protein